MGSSSSSHQRNQRFNAFSGIEHYGKRRKVSESSTLFDVFINHRGPDVKHGLATELYDSLKKVGIQAFLDSREKVLGESFPSTIQTAIKSAKVHIAIFSKRYAESPWCLAELVLMLQTNAKIIPVFYQLQPWEVQPWELRFIEKGEYGKAFSKYEKEKRYLEKLPEWKEALQRMSFVAGEEFNGDCKNIIAAVQKEVQKKTCLHVATYPVGLDKLVEDFQRRCLNDLVRDFESRCLDDLVLDFKNKCRLEERKYKSKVVGIFGMGGCGKTTLAKELFNLKSSNYCRASFLFDVREAHVTRQLHSLQEKLLKDLFQDQTHKPTSTKEGMGYLKDHLQRSPDVSCLIVVDDVDHVDQLDDLMIMDILNKFCNTLVIVTTRDVGVLIRTGISDAYNLKGMDRNNGRELFCWHAFNQPHSSSGYEVLVDDFVDVCGGLPLSLQVLGRHVHGKPHSFWRSALIQARKTLPQDVKHRLKISFDALSGEEKQIFMDIACFFIGEPKSIAERVWEGSGWNAQHSLEMLKDKCLVEETENRYNKLGLRMHDHLRDLGREMAAELSSPLRLWRPQDLQYLGSMGLKNILAICDLRCFHFIFDESMDCHVKFFVGQPNTSLLDRSTSVLFLKHEDTRGLKFVGIPSRLFERSTSVLWLELHPGWFNFLGIPSWVSLQYVQCLIINRARLKNTLWKNGIQAPSQLKKLKISFCSDIEELSLAHLSCLEEILIEHCYHLKSVSGISNLTKLVRLNISGCPELEELRLEHLSCLKYISIDQCSQLESVSGIHDLAELVKLEIELCDKLEFECLRLSGMRYLETISLFGNVKVKHFEVDNCQNLRKIRYGYGLVDKEEPSLQFVFSICLVSVIINGCGEFDHLRLINCQNLKTVRGDLEIGKLEVRDCPELEELPTFSSRKLELEELPTGLILQGIAIEFSEKLCNMPGIEESQVERCMILSHCSNALIRNCIGNLKNVPWKSIVIGRAAGGAESGLNKYLFSEANKVIELGADNTDEEEEGLEDTDEEGEVWKYILCCLVVVDSTTSLEGINKCINDYIYQYIDERVYHRDIYLLHGEWIITIIGSGSRALSATEEDLKRHEVTKKAFRIEVRKDEEWKTMQILHYIVDNLLEL